jgi:hypothetical protein
MTRTLADIGFARRWNHARKSPKSPKSREQPHHQGSVLMIRSEMPERAAIAFVAYVNMGHTRSLRRLVSVCRDLGVSAAIATLRRWSTRYKWQSRLKQYDRRRAAEIQESLEQNYTRTIAHDVSRLRTVQDRFIARLNIDPEDLGLSLSERRRALNVTFRDFCKAVELERLLCRPK